MDFEPIAWSNDFTFSVGDARFLMTLGDYTLKTDQDRIIMLKDKGFLAAYTGLLRNHSVRNMLEFGIFEGGSQLFFASATSVRRISAIEIAPPSEAVLGHVERLGLQKRVRLHYNTSQSDREKVTAILDRDFEGEPLDLIIDDASHMYEHSLAAFEIAFPRLRAGGLYVIEDWGWAHWGGEVFAQPEWRAQNSMTTMVFELTMALGSQHGLMSKIEITPYYTAITKGALPSPPGFRLQDVIRLGGRKFTAL